jgi:hypothetical protein
VPGEFDKDFGYLMPFVDKIAAAGAGLPDPAARLEIAGLVKDEKARWNRIRELLAGAPAQPAPASAPPPDSSPLTAAPSDSREGGRETFAFTVGSLRPKRD